MFVHYVDYISENRGGNIEEYIKLTEADKGQVVLLLRHKSTVCYTSGT